MDKLEQYLDQVCRSIGGAKSLREHVRQELREHLRDAVAEHKAAGLPEEEALARALQDFGQPEEVRSELEAAHGRRQLIAVVIDKAMQWKEKTMKAKWLWTTWALLAVVSVMVLEVLYLALTGIGFVPKFKKVMQEGGLNHAIHHPNFARLRSFLDGLEWAGDHPWSLILSAAAAWGLFEWRVRSENKTFMRLSALGTAAAALMVTVILTTGSMLVLLFLGFPGSVGTQGDRLVKDLTASIDSSITVIEQGVTKKDWETMQENAKQAIHALDTLDRVESVSNSRIEEPPDRKVEQHWPQLMIAKEDLSEAYKAIREKDAARLEAALQKFHKSYGPVREWAKGLDK